MINILNRIGLISIVLIPIFIIFWIFDDDNRYLKLIICDIVIIVFICIIYYLLGYYKQDINK